MLLLFLPLAYSGEPNQTEPTEFIFMVQCVSLQQSNSTIKDSSSLTWVQVEDMNSCSCVSGLELTFYSGVYGTCIGAMTGFGQDAKSLIGISGIFIGVGEILGETPQPWTSSLTPGSRPCVILFFFSGPSSLWSGGGIFGLLNKNNRFGRNPVVLLGLITHFVAFYLIFLNIASDAPLAPEAGTDKQAFITPK